VSEKNQRGDIGVLQPCNAETVCCGVSWRRAPEIVGRKCGIAKGGRHAVATQMHGPLSKIARAGSGRQNKCDAAIIYETVVEKMERFADVARVLIVGQGIRGTHDRSRIERRVVSERLSDNAEMFIFRAVEGHMSASH